MGLGLVDSASTALTPPLRRLEHMSLVPGAETERTPPGVDSVSRRPKVFLWIGMAVVVLVAAVMTQAGRFHRSNFDQFWQPAVDSPGSPILLLERHQVHPGLSTYISGSDCNV